MFQDSICLKCFLPFSTVCASELFLPGLECKRLSCSLRLNIERGLGMRITLDTLTRSGSMGNFVYHVGLPLLIGKIAQFPRKENKGSKQTWKLFDFT